jgi:hypothetical protein
MQRSAFTVLVGLALGACAGISVSQDYAPDTDFMPLRTYDWMPNQGSTSNSANNQLIDARLHQAITTAMEARGYQQDASDPDFFIGYHLILDEQVDHETVNSYWGTGWDYGMYGAAYGYPAGGMATSSTREIRYTVGTLILDFFDADERALIWRGVGEGDVRPLDNPEERQRRADEAVRAILDQFPPGR